MTKRKNNQRLEKQYNEQGSCCIYCKEKIPFELITRDHFKPRSSGNTLLQNKVFACKKCNSIKGSLSLHDFKDEIYKRINNVIENFKNKELNHFDEMQKKLIHYTKILKTIYEILENGGTPKLIFT